MCTFLAVVWNIIKLNFIIWESRLWAEGAIFIIGFIYIYHKYVKYKSYSRGVLYVLRKAVIQSGHKHQSHLALHRYFFPGLSHGKLLGICRVSHGALWWLVSQAPFHVCWTKRVNEELLHHFHHWLSQVASNEHLLCTFIILGCHSLFKEW